MKAVYVSGKYSSDTPVGRFQNIIKAWQAAVTLWGVTGVYAVCPHCNTMEMDGAVSKQRGEDYEKFLMADLDLVGRCNAIYMLDGWENSSGANRELAEAKKCGLKIFYEPDSFMLPDTLAAMARWAAAED